MKYNYSEIEKKWQNNWAEKKLFQFNSNKIEKKFYLLEMFPYPSGRIHMGHVRNYSIGDVYGRYLLMNGYNLLHPMGWDAFGLPAENAAINNKVQPEKWTKDNINFMRNQFQSLGFAYQWDTEVATCNKEYYKWEQWFFLKMYEKGLAFRKNSIVNWCPKCQTVLANEQVINGCCWRCDSIVEDKKIEQWFLRITDYAEELLNELDNLKGWPEQVKIMQKNWIGKSFGTEITFKVVGSDESITVFTTRADTIFGCTYMVLAAEHPLVKKFSKDMKNPESLTKFLETVQSKNTEERTSEKSEKSGVFLEKYAINPVNGEKIPIWTADYVLMEYGTGSVMAVPAHDERDFLFAKKYQLPIRIVIQNKELNLVIDQMKNAYIDEGILVNSGKFNGLNNIKAIKNISVWMEENGFGKRTIYYKLRDWGISRQRYWGTPIPVIYCEKCGIVPVPYQNLPVELPKNIEFTGEGNPLDKCNEFIETNCPKCNGNAKRETDTMDTFIDSSWYFLRFIDSKNSNEPFNKKLVNNWMPVDQYIGGIEHACLHLIYARFFTKALRDLGLCDINEPFKNLLTQGMVCKETLKCPEHDWLFPSEVKDGKCIKCGTAVIRGRVEKMSKSKKNIIDPDDMINKYGADTARLFCLFASPPEKELEWSDDGIEGCFRFLNRIWNLVIELKDKIHTIDKDELNIQDLTIEEKKIYFAIHKTMKKVTIEVSERFHFNTAIAALMELLNMVSQIKNNASENLLSLFAKNYLKMLSIFAPHICEELWSIIGYKNFISTEKWVEYNEEYAIDEQATIAIQVNGKVRARISAAAGAEESAVKEKAITDEKVKLYIDGKTIIKTIYVQDKLLSIVVK